MGVVGNAILIGFLQMCLGPDALAAQIVNSVPFLRDLQHEHDLTSVRSYWCLCHRYVQMMSVMWGCTNPI